MLKVENINTYYGTSHILHNVSLEVQDGEIVVLLGRNGVGKSTTLKSIMGIAPSKSGKITLKGEEITRLTPDKIARKGISFIPEDRRVIPNLTVFENLKLGMLIRGKNVNMNETLEMVFQFFPKLKERLNQMGESLSGGEQQMLTTARGLVANPQLMMIDEPTEGLAPIIVEEIWGMLKKLHENKVTILLVEQNYEMSLQLSKNLRAYILEKGHIRLSGTREELHAKQEEVERYLGVKV
jgi:branched-chain amino acid transport system ATP-binding protein